MTLKGNPAKATLRFFYVTFTFIELLFMISSEDGMAASTRMAGP
jgi:hypothetical protein